MHRTVMHRTVMHRIVIHRSERMEIYNGYVLFGIDVGGTSVKCGLFLTNGTLVEQWEIPTRLENNGSSILPDVADAIKTKLDERGITKDNVDGVGIGIPGPVNENGEVPMAVNLHWGFKAVASELSALTGLPAKAANDANIAALGEAWKGAAEGAKNVILVTLGTGVGGGIIIDSKIIAGYHGAGGEIGHACVNHNEVRPCNCGNHGCLEQYASATGIVRLAKRKLEQETRNTILNRNDLSAKSVFDAVKADDSVAKEIAESFGNYLGRALANLAAVIDPSIFVIGGGVSKAGEILLEYVEKPFQENAFFANKDVKFALATLGNDAGICGAAKLVLDDFAE